MKDLTKSKARIAELHRARIAALNMTLTTETSRHLENIEKELVRLTGFDRWTVYAVFR